uniref:glycosyltransferase family 39 protein n=1 Tax=Castellaniella defragrans TaxID=75697 RepID=UPI0033402AC3
MLATPIKTLRPPGDMLVLACLTAMVCLWTVLCAISHKAPDLDGMEELVWAASLELGYTKHPPLPSWFMYLATGILGRPIWLPFLMGQLFSALGLWFIWKLACEMTTRHMALIVTLLVSVTAYFSLRGTIYNHNTAQLWSIACATWLFYRALRDQHLRDWLWLGLVCALAMMTKHSAIIQFAAFFLTMLALGSFRDARTWRGLGAALATFLAGLAPHLVWLMRNRFEPLQYADASIAAPSRLESLSLMLDFVLDQAGRLVPMVLVLIAWTIWQHRKGYRAPGFPANEDHFHTDTPGPLRYFHLFDARDRRFLLWVGLTPFLSTLVISAVLGTRLEASWASTFFILFGFYAAWWLHGPQALQRRRILILVIVAHIVMAAGYALARGPIAWEIGRTARSTYPGPELARVVLDRWNEYQPGRPLRVIVSNTWMGGNIAVHVGNHAQVFIDADEAKSPWFAPGTALACGAVVAFGERGRAIPTPAVQALYDAAPWKGVTELRWSSERSPLIDLHWAVLPATPDCKGG